MFIEYIPNLNRSPIQRLLQSKKILKKKVKIDTVEQKVSNLLVKWRYKYNKNPTLLNWKNNYVECCHLDS